MLGKLARDRHFGLFVMSISEEEKGFITFAKSGNVIKLFFSKLTINKSSLECLSL
jgi:hypothetical protein